MFAVFFVFTITCYVSAKPMMPYGVNNVPTQDCWYDGRYHAPGVEIVSIFNVERNCDLIKVCRPDGEVVDKEGRNCLIEKASMSNTFLGRMRNRKWN